MFRAAKILFSEHLTKQKLLCWMVIQIKHQCNTDDKDNTDKMDKMDKKI